MVSVRCSHVSGADMSLGTLTVIVWTEKDTQLGGFTGDDDEPLCIHDKLRKVVEDKMTCRKLMKTTVMHSYYYKKASLK